MELDELLKLTKAAIARREYGSIVDDKGRPREGNPRGNYRGQHGNYRGQHGNYRGKSSRGHHKSNPSNTGNTGNAHFQPANQPPPLMPTPPHMPLGPPHGPQQGPPQYGPSFGFGGQPGGPAMGWEPPPPYTPFGPGGGPVSQQPFSGGGWSGNGQTGWDPNQGQKPHYPSKGGQPSGRGQQSFARGQPSDRGQPSSTRGQPSSRRGQQPPRGQPSNRGKGQPKEETPKGQGAQRGKTRGSRPYNPSHGRGRSGYDGQKRSGSVKDPDEESVSEDVPEPELSGSEDDDDNLPAGLEGATAEEELPLGLSEDALQTVIRTIIDQKVAAGQTIDQAQIEELTELVKIQLKTDLSEIDKKVSQNDDDDSDDDDDSLSSQSEASIVSSITSDNLPGADVKHHPKKRSRRRKGKAKDSVGDDDVSSVGDGQRQHVDENAVFRLIVKEYRGSCLLSELAQKGLHLFPKGTGHADILQWLQTKKRMFKVFPTKVKREKSKTLIKVHLQGFQLCFYNTGPQGCKKPNCQHIHLCRDYVIGNCHQSADHGKYSHSLQEDTHNKLLVEKKFPAGLYTDMNILDILRCSLIQVCPEYNTGSCENEKLYELCPKMHMCAAYAMNKCLQPEDACGFSHSLDSENTQKLLGMFHCSHMKPDTIRKSLLVNKSLRPKGDSNPPVGDVASGGASSDVKERKPRHDSEEKKPTGGKSTNKPIPKPRSGSKPRPAAQGDTDGGLQVVDINIHSDDDKDICEMNVRQCCKFVGRCRNHHFPMPYLWQMFVSEVSEWKALDNWNSQIELLYCDPQNKDYCMVST